ncbi:MAG: hypothetical protein GX127_03580 [Eubacteriaceae bacterium]|jgi:hypothetical protein|nr:hypothetical protein [Eubacteriaceae bacterium]
MKSEYFKTWEDYVETHPELNDIESAEAGIQPYEEEMYAFIMKLFL